MPTHVYYPGEANSPRAEYDRTGWRKDKFMVDDTGNIPHARPRQAIPREYRLNQLIYVSHHPRRIERKQTVYHIVSGRRGQDMWVWFDESDTRIYSLKEYAPGQWDIDKDVSNLIYMSENWREEG